MIQRNQLLKAHRKRQSYLSRLSKKYFLHIFSAAFIQRNGFVSVNFAVDAAGSSSMHST